MKHFIIMWHVHDCFTNGLFFCNTLGLSPPAVGSALDIFHRLFPQLHVQPVPVMMVSSTDTPAGFTPAAIIIINDDDDDGDGQ